MSRISVHPSALLRAWCATVFSDTQCPMDSYDHVIPEATPLCDHFLSHHVSSESEVIIPTDIALVISVASDQDFIASDSDSDPFSATVPNSAFHHTHVL